MRNEIDERDIILGQQRAKIKKLEDMLDSDRKVTYNEFRKT